MVSSYLKNSINIGIVGMGARGLSVLERLLSVAETSQNQPINIAIFDPGTPGCGVHYCNQPDYLLLNTMAGQLGIYPDSKALSNCVDATPRQGLDFFDWCQVQDIRISDQGQVIASGGRSVVPEDFLPRRLLGDYLAQAFKDIIVQAPAHVTVTVYAESVQALQLGAWRTTDSYSRGYKLLGDKGAQVSVDRLIVTTGHSIADQSERAIDNASTSPLLIQGLGLTAMDQISVLSQGRGGIYRRDGLGECSYLASGREPKIFIQSRAGLPFCARPNTLVNRKRHKPIALTLSRLQELRVLSGQKQLDFKLDILPLMQMEMRGAALAVRMAKGDAKIVADSIDHMASIGASLNGGIEELTTYLNTQEIKFGALDCDTILAQKIPDGLDDRSYHKWVATQIEADLVEARAGLLLSPTKAAAEVWRDMRDILRSVVDFHGLTLTSHQWFYRDWVKVINRLVAGPQKERSEDLLALMHIGIVTLRHPKSKIESSITRLEARVPFAGICGLRSGIVADLRALGLIRAVIATPGLDGIETSLYCHAIGQTGEVVPDLWVLGPGTEGSTYYNHYIPAPGTPNRAMEDAHRVAVACTQRQLLNLGGQSA